MFNQNEMPIIAHSVPTWLPMTMTWVYNQIKYQKNFKSIVFANYVHNLEHFPFIPIYGSSKKYAFWLNLVFKKLRIKNYPFIYDRAVTKHQPIILHSHFGDRGWYDLSLAKKHNLKHIVTFYGYDVNMLPTQKPIWKKRFKELFQKADLILCEGPYMAISIEQLGCPKEKINIQPLGIEINKISFQPRKWVKDSELNILISGTFKEKKGIPYALETIGHLINDGINIKCTIIGDSLNDKRSKIERKKIINIIEKYQIKDRIKMIGFQPSNVLFEEAYKNHIFCSPSVTALDGDTEGGAPVSIIEMAASGMPIISTLHCDIPNVLGKINRDLLVQERSVEQLVNAFKKLFAMDWNNLISENRNYIISQHNIENTSKSLDKIYQNL